ncbi:MAG: hypothetical protein HKN47_15640 [Pirellulaceae bacterium]|nr:hypothetical protein [Pirellulaceae bacterium]
MQRMTRKNTHTISTPGDSRTGFTRTGRYLRTTLAAVAFATWTLAFVSSGTAQVVQADFDYEASGFVVPAGMTTGQMDGGVMQVGYYPTAAGSSCAAGGCDTGGCDGGCDSMGCNGGGILGDAAVTGGVLRHLAGSGMACGGCGTSGCGFCGGLSNMRHMCIFCRGAGCSVCQMIQQNGRGGPCGLFGIGAGGIYSMLSSIQPYSKAGLCAQRWYDASLEGMFLTHSSGSTGNVNGLTSRGISGPIVLGIDDTDAGGDLEAGFRLSGAVMLGGAGSNIEATWVGEHEWSSEATAFGNGPELFSFISEFGTSPLNGYDDSDRSLQQSVKSTSEFDSVELNYRRRTVTPCCRFQTSWLFGLRYIRYDDSLIYSTLGENNNTVNASLPRFFNSHSRNENKMFGAQAGGDIWWNINPGISLGLGGKLGLLKNDIDSVATYTSNSLDPLATPGTVSFVDGDQDTTVMGEFEIKMIYRLTHSWTVRSSYYLLGVDDVAFGTVDVNRIRQFVTANPVGASQSGMDSLTVQGFSIGGEYVW